MPYTSQLIDDDTGVLNIGSGSVHGFEILLVAQRVQWLAGSARLTHILTDLTLVTELHISTVEIRELAAVNLVTAQLAPGGRAAIVAPENHVFGLARMWSAFMDDSGWEIRIFRDLVAATSWLERPSR